MRIDGSPYLQVVANRLVSRDPRLVSRRSTAATGLLLLPTLSLLRRFLHRCFRLSLLRHCCPPSLSGWRHRCSAVANRSALLSDYYSRKKITVTPLNFVCKCRAPPPRREGATVFASHARRQTLSQRRNDAKFAHIAEVPMKRGFLSRVIACLFARRAHIACRCRSLSQP